VKKLGYLAAKRGFDFLFALILIIILMPLIGILSVMLYFQNESSPLFRQRRTGYGKKTFEVFKFKTMTDAKDSKGALLPDDMRVTKTGLFVRRFSLDEIPQLFNILCGDMSFIGPRPLLEEYLDLYSADQLRRFEVRPGISGWAQVNGRNNLSWTEKFDLDVWYVENVSFFLDVKIFFMTILKVVMAKNISRDGMVTTEKFDGTN
jgi:lipopolysaccharide/colanic/teichoic acid biosynthesis glycosyltransferase